MEIAHRRKSSSSADKFSFPVAIQDSDQFEFGPVTTPGSPNSPADHLFYNGKLLPHVFPIDHQSTRNSFSISRSTSRTSSISSSSSKGSLMSSRSNSTNSRSSNCSSARTSASEASERRVTVISSPVRRNIPARKERNIRPPVCASSQRWQLIAAAPVLKHQGSRSRKVENVPERKGCKKSRGIDEDENAKAWFGRRILKSFVSACKECHAIKTTNPIERVLPRSLEM